MTDNPTGGADDRDDSAGGPLVSTVVCELDSRRPPPVEAVRPSDEDPVVRGLVAAVGGPPGQHAAPGNTRRLWSPLRVILALAVIALCAAWVQKAPCNSGSNWTNGYQYTHLCYSDVVALWSGEGLAQGQIPYLDHPVEYPVLTGAAMQIVAWPARHLPGNHAIVFADATALLLMAAGLLLVWMMVRLRPGRPWDAAMVAVAPGLILTAYINWDLLAVALATGAILAWGRSKPWLAGVLLGLGVATKFYPLVFLGPWFLLCLRAGRMRDFGKLVAGGLAVWLVVNVPVMVAAPQGWARFFSLSRTRDVDWGTFWYWLRAVRDAPLDTNVAPGQSPGILNAGVALLLILGVLGVAMLTMGAERRPRLASVLFLTMAAFVATNKVWSPQYVLWLLPLAVLARPRWRAFLFWQLCEVTYFVAIWYQLDGAVSAKQPLPENLFLAATWIRLIGLLVFSAFVVFDALRPDHDVVRAGGVDDPDGGVLSDAEDRMVVGGADPAPARA